MRRIIAGALLFVLLAPVRADDETTPKSLTPEGVADQVISAVQAEDAAALKALAKMDDPDPWLVADELLSRARGDAALALAEASPRPDTSSLPAYVKARREDASEDTYRAAAVAVRAALEAGAFEKAQGTIAALGTLPDTVSGVRLRMYSGSALRVLDRLEESEQAYLDAADVAERIGWRRRASLALDEAGAVAWRGAAWRRALAAWTRRRAIEQTRGDKVSEAATLIRLGNAHLKLGDWPSAVRAYERARSCSEQAGDDDGQAGALLNLGTVHQNRGDLTRARACAEGALALFERTANRRGQAQAAQNLGVIHTLQADWDEALSFMTRALTIYEALGTRAGIAGCLNNIGGLHREQGRWQKAIECHEKALAIREELGDRAGMASAMSNIGLVKHNRGDWPGALSDFERARGIYEALGDVYGLARTLGNMGNAQERLGDLPMALSSHEKTLALMERLGSRSGSASALNNIGLVHRLLGNWPKALSYQRRSLAIRRELGDRLGVAIALANIGNVHLSHGEYLRALADYEQALTLTEAMGRRQDVAGLLVNLATIHKLLGDSERALAMYENALGVMEALGDRAGVGTVLGAIGGVHAQEGDYETSLAFCEKALTLAESLGDRVNQAIQLSSMGHALGKLDEHEKALTCLERALALSESLGRRGGVAHGLMAVGVAHWEAGARAEGMRLLKRAVRESQRLRDRDIFIRSLWGLAQMQLESGEPARALLQAQRALRELEFLLGGLAEEEGGATRERYSTVFQIGALAAARLQEPTDTLTFLESGRAGSLLETLGGGQAVRFADLPDALIQMEAEAKAVEARARFEHGRAVSSGDLRTIRSAAKAVDEAMDVRREAAARIQREAKRVAGVFYPRAATLEEIQGWLEDGQVLVLHAFCLGEALALVLTNESERIVALGTAPDIVAACEAVAWDDPSVEPSAALLSLRARLIEPLGLGDEIDTVLVSPDGPLGYVPWGALFDCPVACVPSGTTWVLLREEERESGTKILALGDPDYGERPDDRAVAVYARGHRLPPLPATREEAKTIGDVVLLGQEANEERLTETLKTERRWRAVHLACHGLVDTERPTLSSLALTPAGDEDGFLTCLEVFRKEIPADLVTLSACETAKGKVVKAEGIVGLTRAFMYAGAPRVLCSLWKVDDEATRALMIKFYELWNPRAEPSGPERAKRVEGSQAKGKGLGAAEALKQAQAFVRGHEKWNHPHYWAAWVLWGLPN